MAKGNDGATIVIKRVKKVAGGHHGGAWKVAYADFVTAMMAFFLLLWLLNATTEQQRQGISNYFAPTNVSDSRSGAGGVMGGKTMSEGAMASTGGPPVVFSDIPPDPMVAERDREGEEGGDVETAGDYEGESDKDGTYNSEERESGPHDGRAEGDHGKNRRFDDGSDSQDTRSRARDMKVDEMDPKAAARAAALAEKQQFEQAVQELRQAIETTPELKDFKQSLIIDQTSEGLRIQIADQEKVAMFPLGGSQMYPQARELLAKIVLAVSKLPHKISVVGHTDSAPFASGRTYGNWELSADRANASRRALVELGLPAARIARVAGLAETDPLVPDDPASARNRRISITLLRQVQNQQAAVPVAPAQRAQTTPKDGAPGPVPRSEARQQVVRIEVRREPTVP